jgi:hypothetical protein
MLGILLEVCGVALGILLVVYMAVQAVHSARRLNARIQEFKAEQEELQKQGKPLNPYAALAELYAEDEAPHHSMPPTPQRPSRPGYSRFRFRNKE